MRKKLPRLVAEDMEVGYETWISLAMVVLRYMAKQRRFVDSDSFRAELVSRRLYAPPHPNVIGVVFAKAKREKIIEYVGSTYPSSRPEARGRKIRIWRQYRRWES